MWQHGAVVELDPNELARGPVQSRIREPLIACAWLRAVPDEDGPPASAERSSSYAGPIGRPPFVLAVTSEDAVALDLRWPEPSVSILARWPLGSIECERTGHQEMRLRVRGKIDTKVRPQYPGARSAELLDLLAPSEGQSLPSKKRPSLTRMLLGAAALLIAYPSGYFYRAVVINGDAPDNALAVSLLIALVVAPVIAALVVWELRYRQPRSPRRSVRGDPRPSSKSNAVDQGPEEHPHHDSGPDPCDAERVPAQHGQGEGHEHH